MVHLVATSILSTLLMAGMTSGTAASSHAGKVIAAPHDGYDVYSGTIARQVANRLNWGWVQATGYRSVPLRFWYDVNRPTERLYSRATGFGNNITTTAGRQIYDEYQRKLRRAGRISSGALTFLVEIHGHSRSVNAGGRNLQVEVIELATTGFTRAQLRRLKSRYQTLVRSIPASQRVTLAIGSLDRQFAYQGWLIPFHFRASGAKASGSLRTSRARRTLHFELPARARLTASARSRYIRLLANLVEYARKL